MVSALVIAFVIALLELSWTNAFWAALLCGLVAVVMSWLAMRQIGGPRVFEIIVEHWIETWGAGSRNHVFFGQMRSYIADYDISGDTYDPVVRTFLTGVVLDAKSLRVEVDVYYYWIREVTNERKLPNDPMAWKRWVKKNEALLTKQAEKNKAEAIASLKE